MTSNKKVRSPYSVKFDGFNGIDRGAASNGKGTLTDIVNFRLMNDRSLKKRPGAVRKATLSDKPRAYYELDGDSALILVRNGLGLLNKADLSVRTLTTVATYEGDACFFSYGGRLYLMDGGELYRYENRSLTVTDGYAPLYGVDWDPIHCGNINEDLNLLSDHVRISYLVNDDSPTRFLFDLPTRSIDAVFVDGAMKSTSQFTIDDGMLSASCALSIKVGSRVTFYLTTDATVSARRKITSCTRAAIFGVSGDRGADPCSVAFYRGENLGRVACTRRIPISSFAETTRVYPSSANLYVTEADIISVGNGMDTVTASCRRGNSLLLFTEREAFTVNESDTSAYAFPISGYGGCSSPDAAVLMKSMPVTVSPGGILKWSPIDSEGEEYSAECLSLPIDGLPSSSFFTSSSCFLFRKTGELFFTDPGSPDKRVFIYNTVIKEWYSYTGIAADSFFELNGELGFFSENGIFLFDSSYDHDLSDSVKEPIIARVTIEGITFGSLDRKKRLCRLELRASPSRSLSIRVTDASGTVKSFSATDSSHETPGYISVRVPVYRSRHYTALITSSANGADTLYGISMIAAE